MRRYAAARLAQAVLVVLLSLTAVFGMVRLGGDPVLLFLPMDIQAKDVNAIRQQLGFNDPLLVQYARFMRGALQGDFGQSLRYRRDALGLVLERLPATLTLAATSIALTLLVAVPLGLLTAVRRDTMVDHVGTIAMVLGQATPGFWLGLMLIYLFAVHLRWLPTGGTGSLAHLVMPSVVLAAFFSARVARLTRSAVLDVKQLWRETAQLIPCNHIPGGALQGVLPGEPVAERALEQDRPSLDRADPAEPDEDAEQQQRRDQRADRQRGLGDGLAHGDSEKRIRPSR